MRLSSCVVLASLVLGTYAQSDTESAGSTGPSNTTATATATGADYATSGITYANDDTTLTITGTDFATITDPSSVFATVNGTLTVNSTALRNATATSSPTETLLVGGAHTTTTLNGSATLNQTASPTTATPRPTNTVPCNGYPQFCNRKFSNITHVGAHNSPFVRPGNLASNQMLDVETQLNDGIRMCMSTAHRVSVFPLTLGCSTIPNPPPEWDFVSMPYILRDSQRRHTRSLPHHRNKVAP